MTNDANSARTSAPPPVPKKTVVAPSGRPAPAPVTRPDHAAPSRDRATEGGQHAQLGGAEAADTNDFQSQREARPGTHLTGYAGLAEPAGDQPRLRLVAGKTVPGTRYKIHRWLGEGGMGVVYLAEHIDIERKVAMKILRFDLSQQERIAQVFRDEARAASRIGSPNIVEIYDFGELKDGRLFFCMELLDGADLVPESEGDFMSPSRLIAIVRQICKGLHAAHLAGIVHRDIKPENIIVVDRNGRPDTVKLVDFGIAAMLASNTDGSATIAGTPHYMAPEQITGASFDGRLDIYALGCMAYELLAGRPPFDADEIEDLLRMQLSDEATPLSQLVPERDIPPALEAVIMKCLAKDPAERWSDMADFEAALCEAQVAAKLTTMWDDLPLPEVEPDRRERLLREMPSPMAELDPGNQRKWLWPAVAGVSALVAGLAIAFVFMRGAPTEEEVSLIDQLTTQARQAAALTYYVYPPIDDPDSATSYRKVLELEGLSGSADAPGDERGEELREQFAETLITLGDKYWEDKAARRFAREYYVQALLFDEGNAIARERSGITPGMFLEFKAMAASGEFSEAELRNAQWLNALAAKDQAETEAKLLALQEASDEDGLFAEALAIEAARGAGVDTSRLQRSRKRDTDADAGVGDTGDGGDASEEALTGDTDGDLIVDEPETTDGTAKKKKHRRPKDSDEKLGRNKRDPSRAAELADEGVAALRAGKRSQAESLFHQAIAYDSRNAKALGGLSDVYFDTGASQKAVLYAEKAVHAASKNAGYRIKLGDAYYAVLRYRDALEQYEKAKSLGSSSASGRIAKAKAKVGG